MTKNLIFRSWFYFRQGWSIYFAFIFAAINTMVTTYYLAIEKMPLLKEIFPSFALYVVTLASIAIPILTIIGYTHVKRSRAYEAEMDIQFEVNPYTKKMLLNTEQILRQQSILADILIKLSKNEKLTEKEFEHIIQIKNKLEQNVNNNTFKKSDLDPHDKLNPKS